MAKRYELPNTAWDLVADFSVNPAGTDAHGQMIG